MASSHVARQPVPAQGDRGAPAEASKEGKKQQQEEVPCLPLAIGACGGYCVLKTIGPGTIACCLAGGGLLNFLLPNDKSFEVFFESWFLNEYFPQISQQMELKLREQTSEQGYVMAFASHVSAFIVGSTQGLNAQAVYTMWVKHCLPAQYKDYCVARTATVNLGSRRQPNYVTFVGVGGRWMLPPGISLDVQNLDSVLDEFLR
eukprot:TRINITY_DN15803_c0_g2_i1.p1 TRINITY_DN15803_c0_g2~~TRINITY_DN15803_c0_g2_i1.p1  ORF type:complete len:203 (+),score=36.24 TRINITY_DN15803_c0_g2_i1:75-683(+)